MGSTMTRSGYPSAWLGVLFSIVVLTGCAKYTFVHTKVGRLEKKASVGVSFWGPGTDGVGPAAMEAYLSAALLRQGFDVRALGMEIFAGRALLGRLVPGRSFSPRRAMADGLRQGGSLEAQPEFVERLLSKSEWSDARDRLADMLAVAEAVPAGWKMDFMLFVHQFDHYGFAVYLVHLKRKQIVQTMVVSGNAAGFEDALGDPKAGQMERASDGDATRLEMMRLAEYIAAEL